MAKVVQLRGQVPGGWSKERWAWMEAVTADATLLPMPRLLASVLARGFANHETAECRPGFVALSKALGASRATIYRALADLEAAGWISRAGGHGPGKAATIGFRFPAQQVAPVRPEQVSRMTPQQVAPVTPEQVSPVNRTGLTQSAPPRPPYMEQPNMNQNARGNRWPRSATKVVVAGGVRPTPFSHLVQIGTDGETEWDGWLLARGFPPLSKIGRRMGEGLIVGWDMPGRYPPGGGDETGTATALRFAQWLRAKA